MYKYEEEKPWLFTEKGSVEFIRFRDAALELMQPTGAAEATKLMGLLGGDSFKRLACIDRMVEIGDIKRVCGTGSQGSVYVPSGRS